MEFKVYLIGHPLKTSALGDEHNEVFAAKGLPIRYERLDVPPVNFHRVITGLLRDGTFLGAKIAVPYKQSTLAYCQELSAAAQGVGAVNTLVKRPSGLVYGANTDVLGFAGFMKDIKVARIRTALVLGAGGAARVALAGLRELGCARYMVGYRHPRRPSELSSQFKGIRRQITFFPIQELTEFFGWAEQVGLFTGKKPIPAPTEPGANGPNNDFKRWDLLINATPVGMQPNDKQSLITNTNFLRCFERIVDLVPSRETTPLIRLAREADVPAYDGLESFKQQAEHSRNIWIKEYRRHTEKGNASSQGRMRVVRRTRGS